MDKPLKLIIVSIIILLAFTFFNNYLDYSFAKAKVKNGFVNKNVIPICCAWGPEIKGGVLAYSIQGGSTSLNNAITKAIDSWNNHLNGIQFVKTTPGSENIVITFTKDGKKYCRKDNKYC